MPRIDLNPHDWDEVNRILRIHVPGYEVWAFGSRVTWSAKQYSDLDLAVITKQPLPLPISADLKNAFAESSLSIKVDVVDWATTAESFRRIIEKDKVVVQMPQPGLANWTFKRLIDCTRDGNLSYGVVQPGQHDEEGIPIVRVNNVNSGQLRLDDVMRVSPEIETKYKRTRLEGGEVLLTLVGSTGQSLVVPKELAGWNIARAIAVIRPRPEIGANWINICLQSKAVQQFLDERANTTVQKTLNLGDVKELPIPIPPSEVKDAIESVAMALANKIELNRRMNETLEAIARAMFKSWFVDFDPVRAKMSGEPPESICQRLGLTPDLLALFPDRLVDSELGEIPKGWGVGAIGDHCYLNAKSWTAKTIPDEVYYVDLANVKNGIISEVQILASESTPSRARRILRPGDTIVGTVRPGNCSFALIGEGETQLTGSTGFAVLSPKRKELRELVFYLATSDENIDRLRRLADGAAYPAVRPEVVTAGACIVPDPRVIDSFHATTASMIDYQIANRVNSDSLAAARDTLLPKLLSGELRVPQAELVSEAA